jgi:hypothetical protein
MSSSSTTDTSPLPAVNFFAVRRRKFRRKVRDERVPSRQTIHNLVNKLRLMWLLIDKKQKQKRRALTEKLDDTGARIERTPRKSLKRLAQETGVSKSSARTATQLLKLRPYKTTAIHALRPRNPGSRFHFCSCFLQFIVNSQLTGTEFSTPPVICEL